MKIPSKCWRCKKPLEVELTEDEELKYKNNLLTWIPSGVCKECEERWGNDDVPF